MRQLITEVLLAEYETIMAEVGIDATDDHIVTALVRNGAWTDRGARTVLGLARNYGTSILRNALALADAMEIEDGDAGL